MFQRLLPLLFGMLLPLASAQTDLPLGRLFPGRFIVTYADGVIPADAADRTQLAGARLLQRHEHLGMAIVQGSPANETDLRARLGMQKGVIEVAADRIVMGHSLSVRALPATASLKVDDPDSLYHSAQGWPVRQVGGFGIDGTNLSRPGPWDITRGKGVRIAILDSGIDANHPDLLPNVGLNLSEINQIALPSACDDGTPQDQQGHGTWSAGLAAGALGAPSGRMAGVPRRPHCSTSRFWSDCRPPLPPSIPAGVRAARRADSSVG